MSHSSAGYGLLPSSARFYVLFGVRRLVAAFLLARNLRSPDQPPGHASLVAALPPARNLRSPVINLWGHASRGGRLIQTSKACPQAAGAAPFYIASRDLISWLVPNV